MHALILIDIQNDFCPGGPLAIPESDAVISIANRAIKLAQYYKKTIVATQDWHPADHLSFAVNSNTVVGEIGMLNGLPQLWWDVHGVQNTPGADFHAELNKEAFTKIIHKGTHSHVHSYSTFFDNDHKTQTELHQWLQDNNITQLTMMGLATDFCVKCSVLDAIALGYKVNLLIDGCRGVNIKPDDSLNALEEMQHKGANLITLMEFDYILANER